VPPFAILMPLYGCNCSIGLQHSTCTNIRIRVEVVDESYCDACVTHSLLMISAELFMNEAAACDGHVHAATM
jgi:hypothetical protein